MTITTKITPAGAYDGSGDAAVVVRGKMEHEDSKILTPGALKFVASLERTFGPVRRRLMEARVDRQKQFDAGAMPNFSWDTLHIRQADWRVKCIPHDLRDRRVEITGPVERKMVINALNSGAKVFMADFEDSCAPTWRNIMNGQRNLRDAVNGSIDYTDPKSGKYYCLKDQVAVLIARPARLAPDRGSRPGRWCADIGGTVRFRSLRLSQFQDAARQGDAALLLSSKAGKPRRGAALGRCLCHGAGDAWHEYRDHQGDRADRDLPRPPSRWMKFFMRCAGTLPGCCGRWTTSSALSRRSVITHNSPYPTEVW